jgi:hypothetical protein
VIAWIVCTITFCGCSLTGWILWLRIQPRVSREEVEKLKVDMKALAEKMAKAQQALVTRGIWGP